jgi:hypothetical protein
MRPLLKLIGIVVVLVAALQGVVWYLASREIARMANDLRPAVDLRYDATYAWLDGRVGMRNVRVRSLMFGEHDEMTAREIGMRVSGPIALLRLLLDDGQQRLDDGALQVDRLRLSSGLEQQLREQSSRWGYLAPWEALGCNERGRFSGTDYAALGWLQAESSIQARIRHLDDGRAMTFAIGYDMQPLGRLDLDLGLRGQFTEGWIWSSVGSSLQVEKFEMRFADRGMMATRNRYCAGQLGLDDPTFVDRHLRAVRAEIEAMGMFLGDEAVDTYRRFVSQGGSFRVRVTPSLSTPFAEYGHYSASDRLRLLNPSVQLDEGPSVPVTAQFFSAGVGGGSGVARSAETVEVKADPAQADALTFEELPELAGRRISARTREGQNYVGILLGTQGSLVRMEIVRQGGQPQRLALPWDSVVRIQLLD